MRASATGRRHPGCALATVVCSVLMAGCPNNQLAPLAPCITSEGALEISQSPTDKVDLLFVIDNSESMLDEQTTLGRELPRLVRVLTSGDVDEDGSADFPAIDLHFGVVSTNLGAHSGISTCGVPGDDGRLLSGLQGTCSERAFLSLEAGDDAAPFDAAVDCMVQLGASGCGLEQPLDAALKALASGTDGHVFASGTPPQGDQANAGFLRDDSLLVVVIVSDEDDCSVPDYAFFDPSGEVNLNLRCGFSPESLHPVSRYRDAFRALKPDNPELVLFAAITGVPQALVGDPSAIDYQAILDHPDMVFRQDTESDRVEPAPACRTADGEGKAAPARRLTELAAQFGDQGLVQSICQDDYRGALDAVLERIRNIVDAVCLPRPLNPDLEGQVECDVVEVLPAGDRCQDHAGLRLRSTEDGRELCEVAQVSADEPVGWFYDPENQSDRCPAGTGQIAFTEGAEPVAGALIRLECRQPVTPDSAELLGLQAIGVGCSTQLADDCAAYTDTDSAPPVTLFCETRSQTCQLACEVHANCPRGMMCDTTREESVCINPTCPPE